MAKNLMQDLNQFLTLGVIFHKPHPDFSFSFGLDLPTIFKFEIPAIFRGLYFYDRLGFYDHWAMELSDV